MRAVHDHGCLVFPKLAAIVVIRGSDVACSLLFPIQVDKLLMTINEGRIRLGLVTSQHFELCGIPFKPFGGELVAAKFVESGNLVNDLPLLDQHNGWHHLDAQVRAQVWGLFRVNFAEQGLQMIGSKGSEVPLKQLPVVVCVGVEQTNDVFTLAIHGLEERGLIGKLSDTAMA